MINVAFIGGNSQVATELQLCFAGVEGISTTSFIRSEYSSILTSIAGGKWDILDFDDKVSLHQLNSFDYVLDFSYPSVQSSQVLTAAKENIDKIIHEMSHGSTYMYMSSIMAHGMPDGANYISWYKISRTLYSYIKRKIEKHVIIQGQKNGIKTYNIRLAQMHGVLQSITLNYQQKYALCNEISVYGKPTDYMNIAFISTLAAALKKCFAGEIIPGMYTLVENPQWSMQRMFEFYDLYFDKVMHVHYLPVLNQKQKRSWLQSLQKYRPLIETYILYKSPRLTNYLKGIYREKKIQYERKSTVSINPERHLLGKVPTPILKKVQISFSETTEQMLAIREYLDGLVTKNQKWL